MRDGTFSTLQVSEDGSGYVDVLEGGTVNAEYFILGRDYFGDGYINVDGGSTFNVGQTFFVGGDSTGLTISDGSLVTGNSLNISSEVTVKDPNSYLQLAGNLDVGKDHVDGIFTVQNQGNVSNMQTRIGGQGMSSHASIEGFFSIWQMTQLNIGTTTGNRSTLSIGEGSRVNVGNIVGSSFNSPELIVGTTDGSSSPLTIGRQSELINAGDSTIGYAISTGIADVSGTNSKFITAGNLYIGDLGGGTGFVTVSDGGLLQAQLAAINSTSVLRLSGGNFEGGQLFNNNLVLIQGTGSWIRSEFVNRDMVMLEGNSTANFTEDVINTGVFELDDFATARFEQGYSGDGSFQGGGYVAFLGEIHPGNSPAVINLDSDRVDLLSSSELFVEIAGTDVGDFDKLLIGGDVYLDGEISVDLIDGFELQMGQEFLILDVSGAQLFNGQFAGLEEGAHLGDYGDYGLYISYEAGDGNDIQLYSGIALVPEPNAAVILTLASFVCPFTRRKRSSRVST